MPLHVKSVSAKTEAAVPGSDGNHTHAALPPSAPPLVTSSSAHSTAAAAAPVQQHFPRPATNAAGKFESEDAAAWHVPVGSAEPAQPSLQPDALPSRAMPRVPAMPDLLGHSRLLHTSDAHLIQLVSNGIVTAPAQHHAGPAKTDASRQDSQLHTDAIQPAEHGHVMASAESSAGFSSAQHDQPVDNSVCPSRAKRPKLDPGSLDVAQVKLQADADTLRMPSPGGTALKHMHASQRANQVISEQEDALPAQSLLSYEGGMPMSEGAPPGSAVDNPQQAASQPQQASVRISEAAHKREDTAPLHMLDKPVQASPDPAIPVAAAGIQTDSTAAQPPPAESPMPPPDAAAATLFDATHAQTLPTQTSAPPSAAPTSSQSVVTSSQATPAQPQVHSDAFAGAQPAPLQPAGGFSSGQTAELQGLASVSGTDSPHLQHQRLQPCVEGISQAGVGGGPDAGALPAPADHEEQRGPIKTDLQKPIRIAMLGNVAFADVLMQPDRLSTTHVGAAPLNGHFVTVPRVSQQFEQPRPAETDSPQRGKVVLCASGISGLVDYVDSESD